MTAIRDALTLERIEQLRDAEYLGPDEQAALCDLARLALSPDVAERVAVITAHRACHGTEHDPANGKLHGYCIVCGVPWPCAYVGSPDVAREGREQVIAECAKVCDEYMLSKEAEARRLPYGITRHGIACTAAGAKQCSTMIRALPTSSGIAALQTTRKPNEYDALLHAALTVVAWDWSDNDEDCVRDMDALRTIAEHIVHPPSASPGSEKGGV